jgi:hypothetical protein
MIGNQKTMSRKRDRISGLNTVQYKIQTRDILPFNNITGVLAVHIQLECDRNWTPYCEFAKES